MNVPERDTDHTSDSRPPYEYVVIGGGIHGTSLVNYLLAEGGYTHQDICLVEPHEQLLGSFERKARQCGMQTLRSTFVHHIGTEPFSLGSFAEGADREHELVSTDNYPNRPTLELFLDHAGYVVDRRDIDECHLQSRVTGITENRAGDRLDVQTAVGTLEARQVVLAIGLGRSRTVPTWGTSLPDDAPLVHVWDDEFDPTTAAKFAGPTFVVGGGITAAQCACSLSEHADVTLLSRHDLEVELTEAHPYWINWRHIEKEVHTLPPGSKARLNRIRAARNDATIPPYVERRLDEVRGCGGVELRRGEITSAYATDDGLLVRFDDGTTEKNAQVVLATGLDSVSEHPLVESVAESLSLERGADGFPVLDDRTLAWRGTDGVDSSVYVSGALAELSVGPLARNIVGARRVAERLLESRTEADSERASLAPRGRS
ncbi:thioredoxin reductase [Haloprofundus marisrubri]|uniref:Thioredoxin reductase n=1 Tax=Haloprofundus marisrubri TaxID=1514971 RepID=A0A0W1RAS0_9EURY|nr:FAD/NAD(P)-binding protein [Haloprofundus marisrubri]KTG10562.1 thioredoxin reductase [Haloprofundus marisrubri]